MPERNKLRPKKRGRKLRVNKKPQKKVVDLNLIFGNPQEIKKVAKTLHGKDYELFAEIVNKEVALLKKVAQSTGNTESAEEILEYVEKLEEAVKPKASHKKSKRAKDGPNFQGQELDLAAMRKHLQEILEHLGPLENTSSNIEGGPTTNTAPNITDANSAEALNQTKSHKFKYINNEDIYLLCLIVASALIIHYVVLPAFITEILYILELALVMHELLEISRRYKQDKAQSEQNTTSQPKVPAQVKPDQSNVQTKPLETDKNQRLEQLKALLPPITKASSILNAPHANSASLTKPKSRLTTNIRDQGPRTPKDFATGGGKIRRTRKI